MTEQEMKEVWGEFSSEYGRFERVEKPRSQRRDLHAFLLLDELFPGTGGMVTAAEHDEIYLGVSGREAARVLTREQVLELVRCGIRYSYEGLQMFV